MKYLAFKYLADKRVVFLAALLIIQLASGFYLEANAQSVQEAPTLITNASDAQTKFIGILCKVMNWLFSILIVLSVVMVLAAAYIYVTAGGSAEKVKSATKTITYAAIGVVVALFARGMPLIVTSIVGGNLSDVCGGSTTSGTNYLNTGGYLFGS